jgi:uncharacterized protein (DUF952 family)
MTNIYDLPEIKAAEQAWNESKAEHGFRGSPETHNAWIALVKAEQVRRGQRTA